MIVSNDNEHYGTRPDDDNDDDGDDDIDNDDGG